MRVLITGFTAKQRGEGRPQVLTLLDGAERALQHAGHHVERRKVSLSEDLSGFDLAICGLYAYNGTSSTAQKFQATRACLDLPHVLAWDDWNSKATWGTVRNGPSAFWRSGMHESDPRHRAMKDVALGRKPEYDRLVSGWAERVPACVCCAFGWGQHDILRAEHDFGSLLCWDPTPWLRGYYGTARRAPDTERAWFLGSWYFAKEPRWVLASLTDQRRLASDHMFDRWAVRYLGKPGPGKRGWQLEEKDVFRAYCESFGVLSPPYDHLLGSGWWRNRFLLAADAGCVLRCDPRELRLQNSWYYLPDDLESYDSHQLESWSKLQETELYESWALPREQSAQQLCEWLVKNASR